MDLNPLLEMECVAEEIIFRNEENGYTVLSVKAQNEKVVAVGNMPWINVGEGLSLIGRWKPHYNFGMQFLVESYKRFFPSNSKSIIKFLSSGIIKGIGLNTAEKIVEKFKDETLNVLKNEPEKVCEVKGISKKKAYEISGALKEIADIKNLSESLKKYEISPEETIRIYKILGEMALNTIEENPYILCQNGIDLSFERADAIAGSLKKPQDAAYRIKEGIIYVLKHNMNNGHTCLPLEKLISVVANYLGVNSELVLENIEEMVNEKDLKIEEFGGVKFIFLVDLYNSETYCALRINMMLNYPPQKVGDTEHKIKNVENALGIEYSGSQKNAIVAAMNQGILVLTGGPGTGKTTTLKAIIEILKKEGEKVLIAAPTGRAAQRAAQVSGHEAQTIHKLLEARKDSFNNTVFNKNEKNLLDCDSLILDEASMIGLNLFESLLKALPLGVRLIIVGDPNQLPSVGAGNILGDLISCKRVPVVKLKEIFRQSRESLIVMNAHRIVNGEMPELNIKNNDFFFLPRGSLCQIKDITIDLCTRRLPKTYNYSPVFDIQVLTPGRKGMVGVENLNTCLQEVINPFSKEKREISVNGVVLREKDKVMQTRNNYDIYWEKADGTCGEGVYNGDIGIILEIDLESSHIVVKYDDKIAVYELELASELELAYACTVHKSQGSEFEAVILPLYGKNSRLHYRNLLYTAVTRAKSKLIIVGQKSTIEQMVENDKKAKRYSAMKEFLVND